MSKIINRLYLLITEEILKNEMNLMHLEKEIVHALMHDCRTVENMNENSYYDTDRGKKETYKLYY
jgi:hypothetical protein